MVVVSAWRCLLARPSCIEYWRHYHLQHCLFRSNHCFPRWHVSVDSYGGDNYSPPSTSFVTPYIKLLSTSPSIPLVSSSSSSFPLTSYLSPTLHVSLVSLLLPFRSFISFLSSHLLNFPFSQQQSALSTFVHLFR